MPECNHTRPPYYDAPNGVKLEDIVHGFNLPAYLAWAVKYILRADHKQHRLKDLKRARECLDIEIRYLESVRAEPPFECDCHVGVKDAAQPVPPDEIQGRITDAIGVDEWEIGELCEMLADIDSNLVKAYVWRLVADGALELTPKRRIRRAAVSQADGTA